eukprot:12424513-Karenia_brevis.AAC.1
MVLRIRPGSTSIGSVAGNAVAGWTHHVVSHRVIFAYTALHTPLALCEGTNLRRKHSQKASGTIDILGVRHA